MQTESNPGDLGGEFGFERTVEWTVEWIQSDRETNASSGNRK
jgi:hypothetical protein